MRRWIIALPAVLMACGSLDGSGDLPVLPQALKAACGSAQPAASSGTCFAGVDYLHFPPGAIFQVRSDGTVATLYQRAADSLTSYAQAPDGTVYFTNAVNGTALYKIDGTGESIVYRHSTYVRMVRIDSKGQIYFNESSGAGADGTIYRLVNGAAEVFYRVNLATVGGFWGDFGFDREDRLWLSSSNQIPSRLYLVVDGVPQLVYRSRQTAFMGFRFLSDTKVLFAGQDSFLRQLDLCTGKLTEVYAVQGSLQAQDVNTCPR
ncbi:MAG TPA: hypothetical protein VFP52_02240 [Myxococcales bacterium]|nr:hypothetical protein [Myxococcales bacterium]